MVRLIQFILYCSLAALAMSWLAKQTGMTLITWSGWQIELRTSLLAAIFVLFIAGLFFFYRLVRLLILWPGWLGHNWQARRQNKGERALSLGMVAFAAGDHKTARRQARKAEKLLGSGLLPDLLSAQAAHAAGDAKAALRYFTALSRHEDTAYFGHLGLMRLYHEQGKESQSLEAAHKALARSDAISPASIRIFADDLQGRRWRGALDKLSGFLRQETEILSASGMQDGLAKGQLTEPSLLAAHLCILLSEEGEGDMKAYLERALNYSPRMVEASRRLALSAPESQKKSALKRVEKDFKAFPHRQLISIIAKLSGDNDGQLIARLGKLSDASAYPDEARLITAEYALQSGIWASASAMLAEVTQAGQTNEYFLLVADLAEKREAFAAGDKEALIAAGDGAAGAVMEREEMLVRAAHAPHAASWHCRACHNPLPQWEMVCPSCSVLGQVDWYQSSTTPRLLVKDTAP